MKEFDIIYFNKQYEGKLFEYVKAKYPKLSAPYVRYCIKESCGKLPSIIVINKEDEIVGCHLFFNNEALVKGKEETIAWGHQTFLNENYRSDAGIEFVMSINCDNSLGIGYSDVNYKIQKKLGVNNEFNTVYNYFIFNPYLLYGLVRKFLTTSIPKLKKYKQLGAKVKFNIVENANDICFPIDGFWHKNDVGIDLKRDVEFVNKRFVENKVYDYSVYEYHNAKGDSCYFAVRPILYRGISAISLADYRYTGDGILLRHILRAVQKIALRNHIGLILTTGGMKENELIFDGWHSLKRPGVATVHKSLGVESTDYISITPADSDVDFNR